MSICQSLLGFLVLVQFTLFRASFHFEFINYFALQGFDLLVDWRQLPSLQKTASRFFANHHALFRVSGLPLSPVYFQSSNL